MTKQELLIQSEKPKLWQIIIQILTSHWWISSSFQLHPYWTSSLLPHEGYKHFFFLSDKNLTFEESMQTTFSHWQHMKQILYFPSRLSKAIFLEKRTYIGLIHLQNFLRQAYKRQSTCRSPLSIPHWVDEKALKHWSSFPCQKNHLPKVPTMFLVWALPN